MLPVGMELETKLWAEDATFLTLSKLIFGKETGKICMIASRIGHP